MARGGRAARSRTVRAWPPGRERRRSAGSRRGPGPSVPPAGLRSPARRAAVAGRARRPRRGRARGFHLRRSSHPSPAAEVRTSNRLMPASNWGREPDDEGVDQATVPVVWPSLPASGRRASSSVRNQLPPPDQVLVRPPNPCSISGRTRRQPPTGGPCSSATQASDPTPRGPPHLQVPSFEARQGCPSRSGRRAREGTAVGLNKAEAHHAPLSERAPRPRGHRELVDLARDARSSTLHGPSADERPSRASREARGEVVVEVDRVGRRPSSGRRGSAAALHLERPPQPGPGGTPARRLLPCGPTPGTCWWTRSAGSKRPSPSGFPGRVWRDLEQVDALRRGRYASGQLGSA